MLFLSISTILLCAATTFANPDLELGVMKVSDLTSKALATERSGGPGIQSDLLTRAIDVSVDISENAVKYIGESRGPQSINNQFDQYTGNSLELNRISDDRLVLAMRGGGSGESRILKAVGTLFVSAILGGALVAAAGAAQNAVGTAIHRAGAHHTEDLGSWVLQNTRSGAIGGAIIGVIFSIVPTVAAALSNSLSASAVVFVLSWLAAAFTAGFASNALGNAIDWSPKPHQYDSHEAFLNNIIGYAVLLVAGGL